jgi:site-specific recombinase XerD
MENRNHLEKGYNPQNEIIKTRYFELLHDAKGKDEKTIDSYAMAIYEYEKYFDFSDFKTFNQNKAIEFKKYLKSKKNQHTNKPVSKSYLRNTLFHLKSFFEWLSKQRGYVKHIDYNHTLYLTLTRNENNQASASDYQDSYSIQEILSTIRLMPTDKPIERRNKAIISLFLLTTPRVSALQTANIESIKYLQEYEAYAFLQNCKYIKTKFSKNITSFFISNVQDIYDNVLLWQKELIENGFQDTDPLFPAIKNSFDGLGRKTQITTKDFIKSSTTIHNIFKQSFEANNLRYIKPHNFRHTIARYAYTLPNSPQLKLALQDNYGHESSKDCLDIYGALSTKERARVLKNMLLEKHEN